MPSAVKTALVGFSRTYCSVSSWKLRTRSLASFQASSALPRYSPAKAPATDLKSSAALRICAVPLSTLSSAPGGTPGSSFAFFSLAIFSPVELSLVCRALFSCGSEILYWGYGTRGSLALTVSRPGSAPASFCAKNDSRLGQIVGRQFHLHLVARHDADEMFSHLAGNVGENVALPSEIDTKHRARQHLCDRAFGHDLRFFRHGGVYGLTAIPQVTCRAAR